MTCIKTAKKPSYLNTSIPEVGKRAAKTENPSDLDRFSRMQDELEALRNEITKKNRDQLDMMYNLDMDNFSDDTRAYFQTHINGNEAKWKAYAEWKTATSKSIATIEGRVTENESSINILSQWQSSTTNSIATIQQQANANESSINSLTQWQSSAKKSIASIQQKADANGSRISLLVNSDGTELTNSAAGIIMQAINGDTSSIKIKADKIQFEGTSEFITAADLSDTGSTVVSGNRIRVNLPAGEESSSSKLQFTRSQTYGGTTFYDNIGTLSATMDPDKGSSVDSKYGISISAGKIYEQGTTSTTTYNAALKLFSFGSISLESRASDDGGIFISCGIYYDDFGRYTSGGYTTIGAYRNVRLRANQTYADCNTGVYTPATADYVFCTDGIYYNGKRIVDNTREV